MNRIVCAAMRHVGLGIIIPSARHWDKISRNIVKTINETKQITKSSEWEQGFIDKFGDFHDRQEAWKLAHNANQIIQRVGGDDSNGGTLYSENLY